MAMNRSCIGKTYPELTYTVEAEATKRYALAYNEDNPLFIDDERKGGIVAPPLFGVVYSGASIAQAMFDTEVNLDLIRLVHGEQDMAFVNVVRPGDVIKSQSKITDIQEKGSGELLKIFVRSKNQRDEVVLEEKIGFFVRGKSSGRKPAAAVAAPERPQDLFAVEMKVAEDQTYRYADASGDHNPIHVDDKFAKAAGLPGIILHGLCNMAFTSKAIMDKVCEGDARRLRRLKVRFSKPVLPGQTLTTHGWILEETATELTLGTETRNEKGTLVIRDGLAEVVGRS